MITESEGYGPCPLYVSMPMIHAGLAEAIRIHPNIHNFMMGATANRPCRRTCGFQSSAFAKFSELPYLISGDFHSFIVEESEADQQITMVAERSLQPE